MQCIDDPMHILKLETIIMSSQLTSSLTRKHIVTICLQLFVTGIHPPTFTLYTGLCSDKSHRFLAVAAVAIMFSAGVECKAFICLSTYFQFDFFCHLQLLAHVSPLFGAGPRLPETWNEEKRPLHRTIFFRIAQNSFYFPKAGVYELSVIPRQPSNSHQPLAAHAVVRSTPTRALLY